MTVMNKGLIDLLNDKKLMTELKPTNLENKFLRIIPPNGFLTKEMYVAILKDFREFCKKHNIK